ncbi:MAG: nuclear transport factor 2 family protein [Thiotrichales bacterium]|nr:nuclear transport factor 2 family protein [Thiotrichales bacterium]
MPQQETLDLIEKYIQSSNNNDIETFSSCFKEDATVLDEGQKLQGKQAIIEWFLRNKQRYQHKTKPLNIEISNKEALLTASVNGKFEGSPITLRYRIKLESGLIQDLRIA